jgi:hypothetical protein
MPPQPLSRVRRKAPIFIGAACLFHRSALAPYVSQVIGYWAEVEGNAASLLTTILRTEGAPTAAMLACLRASSLQFDMLLAAASVKLTGLELEVVKTLVQMARTVGKKRHFIAHHIWGKCDELPDALLLVPPDLYVDFFVRLNIWTETKEISKKPSLDFDRAKIFVYREADFIEIIKDLESTSVCLGQFSMFLSSFKKEGPLKEGDLLYMTLDNAPFFRATLLAMRKKRHTHTTTH